MPRSKPSYHVQPLDSSSGNSIEHLTVSPGPFTVDTGGSRRINKSAHNTTRVEQTWSGSARIAQIGDEHMGDRLSLGKEMRRSESEQFDDAGYIDEETSDVPSDAPASCTRSRKRNRTSERIEPKNLHSPIHQPQLKVRNAKKLRLSSASDAKLPTSSTSNIKTSNARSSDISPSSSPNPSHPTFSLPPHKIAQTTLRVRLSPSTEFVPLGLRSCITIPTFYASIVDAWDVTDWRLARVKVTFEWLPGQTMVIKRSPVDVLEEFLRTIDEAPCWEEGKRCKIDIEIVVK